MGFSETLHNNRIRLLVFYEIDFWNEFCLTPRILEESKLKDLIWIATLWRFG